MSLRIHGTNGPPKVVVRGPGGTTITSPKDAGAKQVKGKYLLAENKTDGTTSVLLVKPKAGEWTIKAAPGAKSNPTKVDRSDFEAPATFTGRIRKTKKGRDLLVAYTAPKGSKVSLVERGKGIAQTITEQRQGQAVQGREADSRRRPPALRADDVPALARAGWHAPGGRRGHPRRHPAVE